LAFHVYRHSHNTIHMKHTKKSMAFDCSARETC
jgi:hypothetical protein